ncbi:MAG TPA: hypothetical protein VJY54_07770 [Lachnospiraceae bacterium]|nr:hypothetical protein [Lachnospiraceae bacterium]
MRKTFLNNAGLICIGIAMVSLVTTAFTKDILFLGSSFALLGFSILLFILAGSAVIMIGAIIVCSYFIIFGLLLAFSEMIGDYLQIGDEFTKYVLCFGMGGIFLGTFLMNVIKLFACSTEVSAVYQGAERMKVKAVTKYVPRFCYTYKGSNYENTTGEVYSLRKLEKKYQIGESYEIYASEKNPNVFYSQRKLKGTDLILLFLGVLFIMVAFQ